MVTGNESVTVTEKQTEERRRKMRKTLKNKDWQVRKSDIDAAYASGDINKSQFDDLMKDERSTENYLRLKRIALAILLGMIGFLFLSSL